MHLFKHGLFLATFAVSLPAFTCTSDGLEGFLPKNNLKIMVGDKAAGGLSEKEFNAVIDEIEPIFAPIVKEAGGELKVERLWKDGTVNAYAEREGDIWKVSMFGGLARHKTITTDGFSLVLCHEIGHHIGGAPQYTADWASNEGQSDYFATLKCLRRVWSSDDNKKIVKAIKDVPATLEKSCAKQWSNENERALCIRSGMAGDSVAKLFASFGYEKPAKFETPDPKVVKKTDHNHPATQCRLDTYFQGALCEISYDDNVAEDNEVTGTCHGSTGHKIGLRPLCWFKPSVQ